MAVQTHKRRTYYHLAVHCGFCGQLVLPDESAEDPNPKPCPHTLYVATSEGFAYLSTRAEKMLIDDGLVIQREPDGLIYAGLQDDADDFLSYEEITDKIDPPDALRVSCPVGPPAGFECSVGFAPTED